MNYIGLKVNRPQLPTQLPTQLRRGTQCAPAAARGCTRCARCTPDNRQKSQKNVKSQKKRKKIRGHPPCTRVHADTRGVHADTRGVHAAGPPRGLQTRRRPAVVGGARRQPRRARRHTRRARRRTRQPRRAPADNRAAVDVCGFGVHRRGCRRAPQRLPRARGVCRRARRVRRRLWAVHHF